MRITNFKMADEDVLVWTPDLEVSLFHSMKGHKPIGINRHFHMACIHDKFATSTGKRNISSQQLWQHLKGLYNLQALNDAESLPFPNDECDFNLPDEIFEPPGASEKQGSDYNDDELPSIAGLKLKLPTVSTVGSRPTTPDTSPKRKRTRQANTSQPSSPPSHISHPSHPSSTLSKRRR